MNKSIKGKEILLRFPSCTEDDIFIKCIGYNDFHYIEPSKILRRQNFFTIHLIFNGSGTLKLGENEFRVNEHCMFFVPPETDLAYYPDENNLWDYMWFEFTGKNSDNYISGMGFTIENPVVKCRDFQTLNIAAQNIFMKPNYEKTVNYYDVLSLFYKFVASNSFSDTSVDNSIAEKAMSYIDGHYHNQNFTIENLCGDLHISHAQLCRMFKTATGKTPINYLLETRMEEACRLLRHTDMHINEIAYSVGFKDGVHFMKTFKKQKNMTAGEYRKFSSSDTESDFKP